MATTIKDIAKMVGVNVSTVSRAINGTAAISEETKAKIKDAMEKLDYHPNSNARNLVSGSTFTIGLVIDARNSEAFSNNFFIRSVSAIEAVTQEKGFNLLICSNGKNQNSIESLILEKKVDGLILPVSVIEEDLIIILRKHNFPFVVMGTPVDPWESISFVDIDNCLGGEMATKHLYENGYHHPALLVEDKGKVFERDRIEGYSQGIKKYKLGDPIIFESDRLRETLPKDLENFLHKYKEIDSFICTNNDVAFNALNVLEKMGKRIPKDFGLITFDNYPLSEYMKPKLSVIDVDTYKLGEEAAKLLFIIIKESKDTSKQILIPTSLIIRESTKKGE